MIAVSENNDTVVLELQGELSDTTLDEFNSLIGSLIEKRHVQVVLSLKRAGWTSLKALKWLVGNLRKLRQRDGDMKLAGLNPYWTNILELTETHRLFDVYSSVDEALASFRPLTAAGRTR